MPAGRRRSRRAREAHSGHEIDDAVRHDDDFLRRTPGELMRHLRQSERRLFDIARRGVAWQFDRAAKLAVYLYRDLDLLVARELGLGGRPRALGDPLPITESLPH